MARRAYIERNGVDLGLWDSKCMVLEGKYSSKSADTSSFIPFLDIPLQFDWDTHPYFLFAYVNDTIRLGPRANNAILTPVYLGNSDKFAYGGCIAVPSTANKKSMRLMFAAGDSEIFVRVYRGIVNPDAFGEYGRYFNIYNEKGDLAFTYNRPPLSIRSIHTKTDQWFYGGFLGGYMQYPGDVMWGDYSDSMLLNNVHGETSGGVFTTYCLSVLFNNAIIPTSMIGGGGYLGSAIWDPNLVIARRI